MVNLESHNAQMIREGKGKMDRFMVLKEIEEYQLRVLNEAEKINNTIEEQYNHWIILVVLRK